MLVRRQRDQMVFMHFSVSSILKLDGVNDTTWERLKVRPVTLMLLRDAYDLSRATGPHVGRCLSRNSHTVSPCEFRHCLSR